MQLSLLNAWVFYPVLTGSGPMDILRFMAFWATVLLLVGIAVIALIFRGKTRAQFLKLSLIAGIVYAAALGVIFLILTFVDDGIKTILFVPLLVLTLAVAATALAFALKRSRLTRIVCGCIACAAAVAALVCMGVYYGAQIKNDGYYNSEIASVNQIVLYVGAVALCAAIILGAFLFDKGKKKFDSRSIAYAAVCIAMSFALSYIRIIKLPQGGSVTVASLLPLMIYSYMFGTKKGVFAGFIYGILQALQDPYIIHPAQFILDYPAAFAAIGLAGMFAGVKKLEKAPQVQFALGAVVASAIRYFSHVLSGVFAFSAYAADAGMQPWPYSLAYNSFVFADIAIVIVAGVLVFSSKAFVKQMRKYRAE